MIASFRSGRCAGRSPISLLLRLAARTARRSFLISPVRPVAVSKTTEAIVIMLTCILTSISVHLRRLRVKAATLPALFIYNRRLGVEAATILLTFCVPSTLPHRYLRGLRMRHHLLHAVGLVMERRQCSRRLAARKEAVRRPGLRAHPHRFAASARTQTFPRWHHRQVAGHHARIAQVGVPHIKTAYPHIAASKVFRIHAADATPHTRVP